MLSILLLLGLTPFTVRAEDGIRIKDLARLGSARDNALVGYGLVTGLAGTGDSPRSTATQQSISNTLLRFGVNVPTDHLRSRNAAAVMVTTTLPAYARPGDKLDVNVTTLADARSLVGGTLLLTHLIGPDGRIYALAQGPLSVGGFHYDLNGNLVQKNHPTSASIPDGATVERSVDAPIADARGTVEFVLDAPDFTTANRIADALNGSFGFSTAQAIDARRVEILVPQSRQSNVVSFITDAENLVIAPDQRAKIVINERTGTVVSGGNVRISPVSITHGNLKVAISTEFIVSQPMAVIETGPGVRTAVVPQTAIEATEAGSVSVTLPVESSVGDLVGALNRVRATSRDIITILQAIKRAGALHAELIIQ